MSKLNRAELLERSGWVKDETSNNWRRSSTNQELVQNDRGAGWLLITKTKRGIHQKRMGRDLGAVISQPGILTPDCAELLAQTVRAI